MKKLLSTILIAFTLLGSSVVGSNAVPAPFLYGDVNLDGVINISDATHIQRALLSVFNLENEVKEASDFDHDGQMTIRDVTYIQKYLAQLSIPDTCGGSFSSYVRLYNFYADYDSEKAITNVPVTFYAQASGAGQPFTYEFLIDNKIVQEQSEKSTLTYTFEKAENYTITVKLYNKYGAYTEYSTNYQVVEPYSLEAPVITSVHFDSINNQSNEPMITANAIGGSGSYEYMFKITGISNIDFATSSDDFQFIFDEKESYMIRDYSTANSAKLPTNEFEHGVIYTITVQAKDSEGVLSDAVTVTYLNDLTVG